ncbi:ATP-binding protein [Neptunomonas antarctica]|uniref:histidine kinase n=1 Tax=Neptunomonas antarctica TaxID=619304 RepID=A0A1N7M5U8_9GAMM|nr:ATP-binding protein [Neptunomonas antarctica]SIS81468.1 Histidine kinase [Neptunomonas antarctica]
MMLRFRTLTFLLFLITLCGFLSVFALNAYQSIGRILQDETLASLSQSSDAIQHELNTHLRLIDQELRNLTALPALQQEMENGSEAALRQLIMEVDHSNSMQRYQFIILSSLDNKQCYVFKSRLSNLGPEACSHIYKNYTNAISQEWNVFRNGAQVLLAKDYLVTDSHQKVIGRMIGGIKLSDNAFLLNQLANRAVVNIDGIRLSFTGIEISEYHQFPKVVEQNYSWLRNNVTEKYIKSLYQFGPDLQLELTSSEQNVHSLAIQLMKLLLVGALIGLLVSAGVAALLSCALDKQLQKLMHYIRDLVRDGKDVGWKQGAIQEFNLIGKEIYVIVDELFKRRSELKNTNVIIERTLQEKRAILHQLIKSQEQERNHLAQELHDELGQLLTAVRIETVLLEYQVGLSSPALVHSSKIKQLVSDMYATVYGRIMSLRPVELDDMGLCRSIQQIPTLNSLRQTGVKVSLDIDDVIMPQGTDIHLYRIVQEALTNTMKHALATEVAVSLYCDEDQIVLSITDNGQGLNQSKDQTVEQGGFGLLGIKERCEYMGATLTIESENGLSLRIILPRGSAV